MSFRALAMCWLFWATCVGCAHGPRTVESETPKFEHVFQKPLEEALAVTRQLFTSRGYAIEETTDPTQFLTKWKTHDRGDTGNDRYVRFVVTGISVGPRQSVVRIFRMTFNAMGNDVNQVDNWWRIEYIYYVLHDVSPFNDQGPPLRMARGERIELRTLTNGTRDLDLERELTLRLESTPSLEVVSGNVREEPRPKAVRDSDFYLTRWKDEASEAGPCGEAMRGLPEVLDLGLTLLVGEQLGSREAPAVVGELVCQVAEAGLPVALGLSIPRTEQERVDRYLASAGAPSDQDALLEGRFWQRPYQDGRSSRAIMDLIDRVRAMRMAGLSVTLLAYDTDLAGGSKRDGLQAAFWNQRREAQRAEVQVILAGNTHTRTIAGTPWDQDFTPMAHLLKSRHLVVLEMSYAQGTRWGCDLDREGKLQCGLIGSTPSGKVAALPGLSPSITSFDTPTPEGTHGMLYVGALSPSLPAISKQQEAPLPVRPPLPPRRDGEKPPMF
ncbi:hypothetical protein HUW62_02750 [Myxococcus sp. AM011]|uniref:hypothetical protein n=1 Tax=Myxococcus sp. AM011 TaxID=2745200 RepID=UPI0015953D3C|nr:hypothetical protein [Myxococcus sp. AM011]NVJ20142.1 hypothetical protein [Myxococcus sp. AM011]